MSFPVSQTLTAFQPERQNASMARPGRCVASLLALLGMVTAFAATCAAAGPMESAPMQMACCKAGHHTCGTRMQPADCCKTQGAHEQQKATVAKADAPVKQPAWIPITFVLSVFTPSIWSDANVRAIWPDTSPPRAPDRPLHLQYAVLLI
jgi:hypothetical protein